MSMSMENLKKKKYEEYFDVGVVGFSHSAYFEQGTASTWTVGLKQLFKPGAAVFSETARFVISHRKEQREELNKKLEEVIVANGFVVTDRRLKHHL